MADLNVSLILRLVDRMSGPAKAAAGSLSALQGKAYGIGRAAIAAEKGSLSFTKAMTGSSAGAGTLARTIEAATNGLGALGGAARGAARETTTGARAADTTANAYERLGGSATRLGSAVARAGRGFGYLERMQLRGSAAGRMLGGELDKMDKRLGTLARGSLVVGSMERFGTAAARPFDASISAAARWQRAMTGVGITANISGNALALVGRNAMETAQRYALPAERVLAIHGAVLNEGAYRSPKELSLASDAVTGLAALADSTGDPLSDNEAGAMTNAYAYSLRAPAAAIARYNAMMFKGAQLGGTRLGTMARFMPNVMGGLRAVGDGNDRGFAGAIAAFQIAKRRAGSDEAAAIDVQDLENDMNQAHTISRFKKAGVDLPGMIMAAQMRGGTSFDAIAAAARKVVGNSTGEDAERKMKGLFINQQSGAAVGALLQNWGDFISVRDQVLSRGAQGEYEKALVLQGTGMGPESTRKDNAKLGLAVTTGKNLAPVSIAADRSLGFLAKLTDKAQQAGGVVGQAAVMGGAGLAYTAKMAAGVGQAFIGLGGGAIVFRSLFGKSLPLAARALGGQLAGLAGRGLPLMGGALLRTIPAILGFSAALLTNPLTWIVAGIAGVAVGGYLIVKHWGAVKKWIGGFWDWLKTTAAGAFAAVAKLFEFKAPGWLLKVGAIAGAGLMGGPVAAAAAALSPTIPRAVVAPAVRLPAVKPLIQHLRVPAAPPVAAAAAAAFHSAPPPPHMRLAAPAAAPPPQMRPERPAAAASARAPSPGHKITVQQTFNVTSNADPKAIGRAVRQASQRGLEGALHDGAD